MRVLLFQHAIRDGQPRANYALAEAALRRHPGVDVFVLPELWTSGYAHDQWSDIADRMTPQICEDLRGLARETNAAIIGSMITRVDHTLRNRLFLVDGDLVQTYDKSHLFVPMREDAYLTVGNTLGTLALRSEVVGVSICFDLRFPNMYGVAARAGAKVHFCVAQWPAARRSVLRTLATARAIETQSWMIVCNRVGTAEDGSVFHGDSCVIDPFGQIVADLASRVAEMSVTLDLDLSLAARTQLPVFPSDNPAIDFAPTRSQSEGRP